MVKPSGEELMSNKENLMQKLSILLIILLVTTSCQKTSQSKDTAVLTMHACALIDLFLTEMEDAIVTYNDPNAKVILKTVE